MGLWKSCREAAPWDRAAGGTRDTSAHPAPPGACGVNQVGSLRALGAPGPAGSSPAPRVGEQAGGFWASVASPLRAPAARVPSPCAAFARGGGTAVWPRA